MDEDEGYYFTGQTPFRKPNESKLRFHARRLVAIQTLARLEYQVEEAESKFNRALGPVELTFVGLGAVIGTGVFVIMGQTANTQAGPAVTICFILGGIVSGIAALSYAEMASMIPIAGSAYTYAYATLGELAAWVIGWNLVLEYLVGAATVSVGWSAYMVAFLKDAFGLQVSHKWTRAPVIWNAESFELSGDYFNAPAFVITLAVTFTIFFGIRRTAMINNILVVFKIAVLLIMIFGMIPFINRANYTPYLPTNTGKSGEFGVSGLLQGASTVFFAYIGFDSVSTTAQEAKDPQVNLPIGILSTLAISATIYIALSAVTMGVANYTALESDSPLVYAVKLTNQLWLVYLTELGAIAATTSVILVLLIAQSRVMYAMSNDGLIPRFFARVHPKYKTPYLSTAISGVICAVCGGLLPIEVLGDISSIGTIFAFFVVNIGVIILRFTRKTVPRRFKVPGGPILLPGIGAASSILLLQGAKKEVIVRLLVWMGAGLLFYFLYGRSHSEVNNPRIVADEPMRVLHENYSLDSIGMQSQLGYTDEHLRRQIERMQTRRSGNRWSRRYSSRMPSVHLDGTSSVAGSDRYDCYEDEENLSLGAARRGSSIVPYSENDATSQNQSVNYGPSLLGATSIAQSGISGGAEITGQERPAEEDDGRGCVRVDSTTASSEQQSTSRRGSGSEVTMVAKDRHSDHEESALTQHGQPQPLSSPHEYQEHRQPQPSRLPHSPHSEHDEFEACIAELTHPKVDDWELFVESHGFKVYRKALPNTSLYEYKALGHYPTIGSRLLADVFTDLEYRKTWDKNMVGFRRLEHDIIHYTTKLPWPLSPREYYYTLTVNEPKENHFVVSSQTIGKVRGSDGTLQNLYQTNNYKSMVTLAPSPPLSKRAVGLAGHSSGGGGGSSVSLPAHLSDSPSSASSPDLTQGTTATTTTTTPEAAAGSAAKPIVFKMPAMTKSVRVEEYRQDVVMIPSEDGKGVYVHFQYFDDPKGHIPSSIVNWATKHGIPGFLRAIEEACLKRERQQASEAGARDRPGTPDSGIEA
ncbi:Cationic amino acid transporter-1 [Actinomortierella ambigua]|uniref:Cationic amino acid transporter-1 n=1 Tax=Actinomortierella ambigua TaxID=1343610 RepID=A0A9P6QE88_9FUNG|nr:Cationic amino acid transporter-1 [Actinomortierella ambigua]